MYALQANYDVTVRLKSYLVLWLDQAQFTFSSSGCVEMKRRGLARIHTAHILLRTFTVVQICSVSGRAVSEESVYITDKCWLAGDNFFLNHY
jgi:hypothetical protein